jgi:hypothetical protein
VCQRLLRQRGQFFADRREGDAEKRRKMGEKRREIDQENEEGNCGSQQPIRHEKTCHYWGKLQGKMYYWKIQKRYLSNC